MSPIRNCYNSTCYQKQLLFTYRSASKSLLVAPAASKVDDRYTKQISLLSHLRGGGEGAVESRWEEKDERLGEERLVIATIILENACPAGNAMSAVVQSEVENMC